MSYRRKKLKRSKIRNLIIIIGRYWAQFFSKKRRNIMLFCQTISIMEYLRGRARYVRPNNSRINDWVDRYIDDCMKNGREVTILTQWCLSKDLEMRREEQSGEFLHWG